MTTRTTQQDGTESNDGIARGPYTMRWADDLGNDTPSALIGEHMPLDAVLAWQDAHEDEGTIEILDEGAYGLPACGFDVQWAGGVQGCDCYRCSPSLHPWLVAAIRIAEDASIAMTADGRAALRAALPSVEDEATFRAAMQETAIERTVLDTVVDALVRGLRAAAVSESQS